MKAIASKDFGWTGRGYFKAGDELELAKEDFTRLSGSGLVHAAEEDKPKKKKKRKKKNGTDHAG